MSVAKTKLEYIFLLIICVTIQKSLYTVDNVILPIAIRIQHNYVHLTDPCTFCKWKFCAKYSKSFLLFHLGYSRSASYERGGGYGGNSYGGYGGGGYGGGYSGNSYNNFGGGGRTGYGGGYGRRGGGGGSFKDRNYDSPKGNSVIWRMPGYWSQKSFEVGKKNCRVRLLNLKSAEEKISRMKMTKIFFTMLLIHQLENG